MTIRVTITKPGVTDAYGIAMAVGTTYTVEENFGLSLIQQGRASDTDEFLDERINAPFDEVVYPIFPDDFSPVGLSVDGTSLVSGDGASLISGGVLLRKPAGLKRLAAALSRAWYSPAQINCIGDSITLGAYSNDTTVPVDSVADAQSWVGVLRTMLSKRYSANPSGFIAANDSRATLTNCGTPTQTVGMAINTVRSDNTVVNASTFPLVAGSGSTLSFAVPACTDIEIIYCDSLLATTAGGIGINTGTFKYSIDGGADLATTVADNTYGINYKRISTGLTGLSNATHTLLLTAVTASCYIVGIIYKSSTGVIVNRFGFSGATALDLTGDGYTSHFTLGGPNRIRGFHAAALAPVTINAVVTSGSRVCTMASSTAALKRGMPVGANAQIPQPCYIASVDSDTQITLSAAATGSNAARPLFIGAGPGTLGGDLDIIAIGHNDWRQQNDATYNSTAAGMTTQLQSMINAAADAGRCVLLVGEPKSNTSAPTPQDDAIDAYWAALDALADANDHVACLQINRQWGTFAQGVTAGYQNSSSGVHPLRLGHANMAAIVYAALMATV